jgi:hypothetical protein
VTVVNARAVTVYLWHNVAIAASFVVGETLDVRTGQLHDDGLHRRELEHRLPVQLAPLLTDAV